MRQRLERALLVISAAAVAAPLAAAQTACFEPASATVFAGAARALATADFDGDGDLDLLSSADGAVRIAYNDGDGTFATPVVIAAGGSGNCAADFDGDGRPDALGGAGMLWNEGNGNFVTAPLGVVESVENLSIGDVDGDGLLDVVGVHYPGWPASSVGYVFHNDGARGFWSTSFNVGYAANSGTALGDVDADGDLDFLVTHSQTQLVAVYPNDGSGWFGSEVHLDVPSTPTLVLAAQLDGGPALDVAAIDIGSRTLSIWRGLGAGAFAPRVDVAYGVGVAFELSTVDLDGDGDLDLVAPIWIPGTPATGRLAQFVNDGSGGFTAATTYTTARPLVGAISADFDRDGDADLATIASVTGTTNDVEVRRGCRIAGRASCAGDGSASACPCANTSPSGSQRGCLNSTGVGAGLRGTGALLVTNDTSVLEADGLPGSATTFFFQGTAAANGGQGAPFGDGLSCATGTLRRLGVKSAVSGSARYPEPGEPAISVRGLVLAPGTRTYQVLYRNAAAYCTPATFNLTNGLVAVWR